MGGASFPTYVKLSPPDGTKIEYVIVNASECEPYLTVDYHTVKESCKKMIDGLAIEMHIFGCRGIVALENNKLDLMSGNISTYYQEFFLLLPYIKMKK